MITNDPYLPNESITGLKILNKFIIGNLIVSDGKTSVFDLESIFRNSKFVIKLSVKT